MNIIKTETLMDYLNVSILTFLYFSIVFFMMISFGWSSHDHFNDDSNAHNQKVPPVIRSGGLSPIEQQYALEAYEEHITKARHKLVAEAAAERAEVAQLVFAFRHKFIVPESVKALLPSDVQAYIPHFDMYGTQLDLSQSYDHTFDSFRIVSYANGYGVDLEVAASHPDLAFVRLINESGLSPDQSPLDKALVMFRIAAQLYNADEFGLTTNQANALKASLYNHAAAIAQENIVLSVDRYTESYHDTILSIIQLKHWAACQEPNLGKKLSYLTDAISLLETYKLNDGSKWAQERAHQVDSIFTLYEAILLEKLGEQNGQGEAVHRFVNKVKTQVS